jgi:hypothetical protein
MASDDCSEKAETGMVPEVANLGIMRPPFVYLGSLPYEAISRPELILGRHHEKSPGA